MTVLVPHDPGCKWGRFNGTVDAKGNILTGEIMPGHSDAAKRFADHYNLHRAAGQTRGFIAVALEDGDTDGTVYPSKAAAVGHKWPNDRRFFYCSLAPPVMSVCAAESLLRYKRIMNQLDGPHTDRDAPGGGLEVIPRVAVEDQEAQIRAVRTGLGALPLGLRKG